MSSYKIVDEENNCTHTFEQPNGWGKLDNYTKHIYVERQLKKLWGQREDNARWRITIFDNKSARHGSHLEIRDKAQLENAIQDIFSQNTNNEKSASKSGNILAVVLLIVCVVFALLLGNEYAVLIAAVPVVLGLALWLGLR